MKLSISLMGLLLFSLSESGRAEMTVSPVHMAPTVIATLTLSTGQNSSGSATGSDANEESANVSNITLLVIDSQPHGSKTQPNPRIDSGKGCCWQPNQISLTPHHIGVINGAGARFVDLNEETGQWVCDITGFKASVTRELLKDRRNQKDKNELFVDQRNLSESARLCFGIK